MSNEWGLVVLGVIFLGFAAGCWAMMEKDVRYWTRSSGTVVDMVKRSSIGSSSSGSRTMNYAVIEFETPDGQRHRATSTYGLRAPPAMGAILPIRYDAADTSRVTTAPTWFRWAFSYGFGAVGLIFLVGGVAQMAG